MFVRAQDRVIATSDPSDLRQISGPSGKLARFFRNCAYFRGKARLQSWFLPRSGTERVSVFGYDMLLDLSDVIQRDIYSGVYEPFETEWLKRLLRPGMTFVDVGANVGYYTWLAARLVGPTGRVVAFEPGPYAFERLQRVVENNGIENVECQQFAVSDRAGTAPLYVPPIAEGNYNPSLTPYMPGMVPVEVPVDRFDDLVARLRVGRVDVMKVDVEGHELSVFRGAAGAIREGRIANLLCEFNQGRQSRAGSSCDKLERWLSNHHFYLSRKFPSKWGSKVHNRLYTWEQRFGTASA